MPSLVSGVVFCSFVGQSLHPLFYPTTAVVVFFFILNEFLFNSGSIPTTYCLFISHLLVCEHCACVHSSYTFCHFQFGRFICSKTTIYKQISCHATNLSLIHHILFLLIHFIIPHQTFDSPPSHPNSLNTPLTLILLTPTHIQPPL